MEQNPCKIYYCYKATNKDNGKIYIGFATDPHQRWREHKRDAEKGKGFVFAAAIRKHGWTAFEFEIICCGKDKRTMLEYVEPSLIEQYHSHITQNGYNVLRLPMLASCGYRNTSQEIRQKMSVSQKRRFEITPHTEETRTKLRAARVGRHLSEETKNKISGLRKGFVFSKEARQKMSATHKEHVVTKETRIKIRIANTGRFHTEETKKKLSESAKIWRAIRRCNNIDNVNRQVALEDGQPMYEGIPCKKFHHTERRVSDRHCVLCSRINSKQQKLKRHSVI